MNRLKRITVFLPILSSVVLLSACATSTNYYDPLEPLNRVSYRFNSKLDRYALKPIAKAYTRYIPEPAQKGVNNFFGNINDMSSMLGNLLEGELKKALRDTGRIMVNTLFGIGGIIDWASDMGLEKQNRSIGKALGRWGISTGPYLVLPLLGPTSLRDTVDPVFNWTVGVPAHFNQPAGSYSYLLIGSINTRAAYLPYEKMLDTQMIFDQYTYTRNSYLQKQYYEIYRGNPPKPLELGQSDTNNLN